MKDFEHLDATALAELVRTGKVSPLELVTAALARIEQINPTVNAVIRTMGEQAREAARGPLPAGPFAGVPYLLKDIMAGCKGVPTTSGSRCLQSFVPDHDSVLVARLRAAGFIFVGKTNTPEFGLLPTTEPVLYGATHNPWRLDRTPGGSSGGAAAAVASGMVPAAHGNDGGGSIRIPASCCGLFGLKPTRGRISLGPDVGDVMSGLVSEHALTRSVRDSAAILDATEGAAPGDPYVAPRPLRPYVEELNEDPGKLRIALSTAAPTGAPVHEDCRRAAVDAAKLCEELGHSVEEASPPLSPERFSQSFMALWTAGTAASVQGIGLMRGKNVHADELEPFTWGLSEIGRQLSASDYLLAVAVLQHTARTMAAFHERFDVWLTPTLAQPPLPLGHFDTSADHLFDTFARAAAFAPFTPIANATGQPAMSVPLSWNQEGLPIGVHFTGRFGDEGTLLRLAAQLERARPWANRLPAIPA